MGIVDKCFIRLPRCCIDIQEQGSAPSGSQSLLRPAVASERVASMRCVSVLVVALD